MKTDPRRSLAQAPLIRLSQAIFARFSMMQQSRRGDRRIRDKISPTRATSKTTSCGKSIVWHVN